MSGKRGIGAAAAIVLVTLMAGTAWAQVQRAPREYRGLFGGNRAAPGEAGTTLALTLTGMGGYDDNALGETGTPGSTPGQLTASGYTGLGVADLVFRHGRQERFVEATGSAALNVYSVEGTETAQTYLGQVRAQTRLRRRTTLRAHAGLTYQDYFTLAFLPVMVGPDMEAPTSSSADFAVADRQSWNRRAGAELSQGLGRSNVTTLRYEFDQIDYDDAPEVEGGIRFAFLGDSTRHTGTLEHRVALGRRNSITGRYSYSDVRTERLDGTTRPFEEQRAEVVARYERRVSRRRMLLLEGGVGGSLLDTVNELTREPAEYWNTVGHALGRIDIGRSWSAQGRYERGWELRQGFTVPFFTDEVTATVGGFIGRRFDLVFNARYATGVLGLVVENPYTTRDASVQARYAITSTAAVIASYLRYYYEFDRPELLPPGFAPTSDRHVARVGLTFWVPLLGSWREPAAVAMSSGAHPRTSRP